MIFVLSIAASAIFICTMGSSYAYYTATSTDINITTGTVDNGISVIFADNNYVNVNTGVPLDDDQVMENAKANSFTVIPDASKLNGYDAYVNVSLTNVVIDDALKVTDFKYSLICSNNSGYQTTLGSGDGTAFTTGTDLYIGGLNTPDGTLNISNSYQCNFRVWIANDASASQNELMDKKFSALLKVNTIMRK